MVSWGTNEGTAVTFVYRSKQNSALLFFSTPSLQIAISSTNLLIINYTIHIENIHRNPFPWPPQNMFSKVQKLHFSLLILDRQPLLWVVQTKNSLNWFSWDLTSTNTSSKNKCHNVININKWRKRNKMLASTHAISTLQHIAKNNVCNSLQDSFFPNESAFFLCFPINFSHYRSPTHFFPFLLEFLFLILICKFFHFYWFHSFPFLFPTFKQLLDSSIDRISAKLHN